MSCKCHGMTFCPDLICVGYDDDVPVYVRRDSPEGITAQREQRMREIERDHAEFSRLREKYGWR